MSLVITYAPARITAFGLVWLVFFWWTCRCWGCRRGPCWTRRTRRRSTLTNCPTARTPCARPRTAKSTRRPPTAASTTSSVDQQRTTSISFLFLPPLAPFCFCLGFISCLRSFFSFRFVPVVSSDGSLGFFLPNFTSCRGSPSFTLFYRVLLTSTEFYLVLPSYIESYRG